MQSHQPPLTTQVNILTWYLSITQTHQHSPDTCQSPRRINTHLIPVNHPVTSTLTWYLSITQTHQHSPDTCPLHSEISAHLPLSSWWQSWSPQTRMEMTRWYHSVPVHHHHHHHHQHQQQQQQQTSKTRWKDKRHQITEICLFLPLPLLPFNGLIYRTGFNFLLAPNSLLTVPLRIYSLTHHSKAVLPDSSL